MTGIRGYSGGYTKSGQLGVLPNSLSHSDCPPPPLSGCRKGGDGVQKVVSMLPHCLFPCLLTPPSDISTPLSLSFLHIQAAGKVASTVAQKGVAQLTNTLTGTTEVCVCV